LGQAGGPGERSEENNFSYHETKASVMPCESLENVGLLILRGLQKSKFASNVLENNSFLIGRNSLGKVTGVRLKLLKGLYSFHEKAS
jgi:hypothetical protein